MDIVLVLDSNTIILENENDFELKASVRCAVGVVCMVES